MSLVAINPKHSSAHYDGSFHFTWASEPGTKAENFAGAIWSIKLILQRAEKSWFGWQKGRARLAKDWKVRTSDSSIRKCLLQERSDAQSDMWRSSKATVLKKQKLQLLLILSGHFLACCVWRSNFTWYKVSPFGKNQIGQFLPKEAKKTGLQVCERKISNHLVLLRISKLRYRINRWSNQTIYST